MRSTILTILPHPSERQVPNRPALSGATSPAGPDLPQAVAGATPTTLPSIESILLQRLLAEVEARQLARVQPTYVIDQTPAARQTTLVRTLWAALWALSIIICVVSVKYIDSQTMPPRTDAAQSRAMENLTANISDQNRKFSTMIDSMQGLASAIALSSSRTAEIPDMLTRLGSDLQEIHSPQIRKQVELVPEPTMPVQQAEPAPIPLGGHHHAPLEYATVAPPDVIVHHNSLGVMDYWLVPRVAAGVRSMVKVVPVSQTNAGSLVHDVNAVKDYMLTPSGDWIPMPESNGNQ